MRSASRRRRRGFNLRLLVDEDTQAHTLVRRLREAGHDVRTVAEEGLNAAPDPTVLAAATADRRTLLTRNAGDFERLHRHNPVHFGILAVYADADPAKNMAYPAIAAAIGKLEYAGLDLAGEFLALNAWR